MKRGKHIFLVVLLLALTLSLFAQRPLGRVVVHGGRKQVFMADTLVLDSLQMDSLRNMGDSVALRDSLYRAMVDRHRKDSIGKVLLKPDKRKFSLTRDTISSASLLGLSLIPGMGQIYNRQWWKVPVFYTAIGGFMAGGFILNNQARNSQNDWQAAVNAGGGSAVTNPIRERMEGQRTASSIMFALAGATYLYQMADATFNYRGNSSHIRKATTLAALFPGAGFIYTKTYWRLPIYYGGFAVLGTVIDYNQRSYQRFRTAWEIVVRNDPNEPDEFGRRYSAEILKNAMDGYRRDRDFGIICMVGVYILSIVDTYVISTLKNWDISPDLSVKIEPTLFNDKLSSQGSYWPSAAGLSLKVKF